MPNKDDDDSFMTLPLVGLGILFLAGQSEAQDPGDGNGNGDDSNGGGDNGNGGGQNQGPTASFVGSVDEGSGTLNLDATGSTDPDGSIQSYEWVITEFSSVFAQPTGPTPSVNLPTEGSDYTAYLTVTDDAGATGEANQDFTWQADLAGLEPDFSVQEVDDGWRIDGTLSTMAGFERDRFHITGQQQGGSGSFERDWGQLDVNCCVTVNPPPGTYDVTFTVHTPKGSKSVDQTINFSDGGNGGGTTNQPPVATFDSTRSGVSVTLDPSGSHDPDGTIENFEWELRHDGQLVEDRTTSSEQTFIFDQGPGEYEYILTVTDDDGASATYRETTTINGNGNGGDEGSAPPTAVLSLSVTGGGDTLELDFSGSHDPDSQIDRYDYDVYHDGDFWIAGSKPASDPQRTYTDVPPGEYTVDMTVVTDNPLPVGHQTDSTTRSVVVSDNGGGGSGNEKPNAVIGLTKGELTVDGSTVQLSAGQSHDPDGFITDYEWTVTTPEGFSHRRTGSNTTLGPLSPGQYSVQLVVTDDDGASDTESRPFTIPDPFEQMDHTLWVSPYTQPLTESSASVLFEATGSVIVDGPPTTDGNTVIWDGTEFSDPVRIAYNGQVITLSWWDCSLVVKKDGEYVDPYSIAPDASNQPRRRWLGGTDHVVETTIYTTQAVYDIAGWTPAETCAEWLAGNLEWHGISYDICFMLGPMDAPVHHVGCPFGEDDPTTISYWEATVEGSWQDGNHFPDDGQRVEGPLTTLRKNSNVLLTESNGGGCHERGGAVGVSGIDGLDTFEAFDHTRAGESHDPVGLIYTYLHESAHGIAAYGHVENSGGRGWYDDQMRWHATPAGQDTVGEARENVCGELIEERFPDQTQGRVNHLLYSDCTAGLIRSQSETHPPGVVGNTFDLRSRPPQPGCGACGCSPDRHGMLSRML